MAHYNCLLFDLDGTLLDFGAAERAALTDTLAHFDLPCDEQIMQNYSAINAALWLALEKGEIKKDKLVVRRFEQLLESLQAEGDPAAINEYYLSRLSENAFVYPGVPELLHELGEVATIAIISNGVERVVAGRMKRSGLSELVDEVFVSEKMGITKPSRRFFDVALNTLGVNKRKKVLVIGDSLKADIQGGINAELDTCWVNMNEQDNPDKLCPTFTITDLQQLMPIVMEQEELDNVGNPTKRHLV